MKIPQTALKRGEPGRKRPIPGVRSFGNGPGALINQGLQNSVRGSTNYQELSSKAICLIGVGGIGCWVSYGLACIGIAKLILVDGDTVDESNLSRQILYSPTSIGMLKVEAAKSRLTEFNPDMQVCVYDCFLGDLDDVSSIIGSSDFVVLSADKPPRRISRTVHRYCKYLGVPACTVGYCDEIGIAGPILDRQNAGNLQILNKVDRRLRRMQRKSRYQAPSFGPVNAAISAIFVMELVKYFVDKNTCTIYGKSILWDPITMQIEYQESPYL